MLHKCILALNFTKILSISLSNLVSFLSTHKVHKDLLSADI